jgi:hypothetical protein
LEAKSISGKYEEFGICTFVQAANRAIDHRSLIADPIMNTYNETGEKLN